MIGYLDPAALVPRVVAEPTTEACREFWDASDTVVASRLAYVEASAALAQARRMGRLTGPQLAAARELFEELWQEVSVIEVDEPVVRTAADYAGRFELRGYDAVHCAAADHIEDVDTVAATGDKKLLHAWRMLGLATFDTNQPVRSG